jgi:hypothetical protein
VIALSYLLYNLVFIILSFFALPASLLKILLARGSFHGERWGVYSPEVFQKLRRKPLIWFHAASVGEVRVALSLLGEMKKAYSRYHSPGESGCFPSAWRRYGPLGAVRSAVGCEKGGETHQSPSSLGGGNGAVAQPPQGGQAEGGTHHPL